jgi:hypothetical protein
MTKKTWWTVGCVAMMLGTLLWIVVLIAHLGTIDMSDSMRLTLELIGLICQIVAVIFFLRNRPWST